MKRVLGLSHNSQKKLLIASFGVLGFTALVFQTVFAKHLVLVFGLTAPAAATVLAVYFTGLALGGFIFGKLADRAKGIGRLYAALFIGSGLWCLFTPFWFSILKNIILAINKIYPLNFSGFNFFAIIFAFLFLIVPSIFIGGGLPVIAKFLGSEENKLAGRISFLYFVDTFGSALGAAASGFWFLPAFGNNTTVILAAVVNLVAGVVLFAIPVKTEIQSPACHPECSPAPRDGVEGSISVSPLRYRSFLAVFFLTGFLAMAMETLYTRSLILFIGSSTYAFSLMLVVFLLGIALGSLVFSFFADRLEKGFGYLGMFCGLLGFYLFLTVRFFDQIPFWFLRILGSFGTLDFSVALSSQFVLLGLVIFPTAFLMGIIFPLGIKLSKPSAEKTGEGLGVLYFANTMGGVLGSLVGGLVFLPLLGYQRTAMIILAVYLLLGAGFVLKEKGLGVALKIIIALFFVFWIILSVISPPWQKGFMSLGVFPYAGQYLRLSEKTLEEGTKVDKVLFYKEGMSQVAVIQRGGEMILRVNGKTDAGTSLGDMESQILIGTLPLFFHKNPKNVLIVGLGSGITAGAVSQFPGVEKIDIVEIDPSIVLAARQFKVFNHDILTDPRVKVVLADGRNYLQLSDKEYDVISSHPSNLWISGNANLFTREYYETVKSHLKKGGVALQWVHEYAVDPEDIKTILKTFSSVFPSVHVFQTIIGSDLLIIGSSESAFIDFNLAGKRLEDVKIREEMARIYFFDPYALLSYAIADRETVEE